MPTQTGSIDFTSTGGFKSYATNKYATQSTVSQMQTDISQNATDIALRATKTEASQMAQPNLSPFFSHSVSDVYSDDNLDGYWHNSILTSYITELNDGWAHIKVSNTGTSNAFATYFVVKSAIPESFKPSTKYTFLVETRNVTKSGTITVVATHNFTSQIHAFTATASFTLSGDENKYLSVTSVSDWSSAALFTRGYVQVPGGASVEMDIRISLYEGEYSGPYKPYVDQTLSSRVKSAETAIEQNAEDITLRATKAETYQSAQPNLSPFYSRTPYNTTAGEGGEYWNSITSSEHTSMGDGWQRVQYANTGSTVVYRQQRPKTIAALNGSETYTLLAEFRNVNNTGKVYLRCPDGGQSGTSSTIISGEGTRTGIDLLVAEGAFHMVAKTNPTTATNYSAFFGICVRFDAGATADFECRVSIYRGEYTGPYKPYSGSQLYASQAELKVANDQISSKVSKDGVISSINQSAETVKIQASRVEIDGTAVFTAISSDVDDAITGKGYATTTQAQGYATTAKSEAISAAATDATTKANTAETNAKSYADDAESRIISRGEQLVINGNGFMGDNTNFTDFTFDGSMSNNSPGSFTRAVNSTQVFTDKMFPVDASKEYIAEFDVVAGSLGAKMYAMLTFYDVDKKVITVQMVSYFPGSTTTLARELKNGDTVVYLTDASGWTDTSTAHQRSLIIWDYTNSFGYTYPAETYSRNYYSNNSYGIWNQGSLDKSNNTIALRTAWTGGTHAAGTSISQNSSGGVYSYFWYINSDQTSFPTEWTHISGTYKGMASRNPTPNYGTFWPGTAYCRIGWLWNYQHTSSAPQSQIWITNVSVKEHVASSSDAVKRTQRIWYRKSASGAPATPGTASSNWVTKADDGNDAWTKMHIAISSTHKYIYTCEQYEMADGTVGYTSVLLDNTITVVDGANIITGSVKANAISATSGTFDVANIPNLSAAKITSGTIDAARIDASKLTIGGSGLATSSDVSTAIKSVSQNWFATCTTAAGTKDKVATITPATTDFTLKAGATVNVKFTNTNSYNATASSNVTLNVNGTGAKNIYYGASSAPTGTNTTPFGRANYTNTYVYDGTYWVWVSSSADNNTTDIPRSKYEVNISAAEAVTNGHIICGTSSGYRNIAANVSFDLNYPLLFAGTAIVKGATTGTRNNNFAKYQNADFSKNGTITSGAASKMLYLKGTVDGKTFKIAASPFMTTVVPTSDDGFAYVPLGYMSSATVGYFDSSTDVYAFRNGAFQKLDTVAKYITAITDAGIRVHAKTNPTTNYAAIDADGMDVVKGGVSVAQFGKSDEYGPSTRIGQESKTHIVIDTIESEDSSGSSGYEHVYEATSEVKLYGADGTRPNLRLYDHSVDEDDGELNTYSYETVGIDFGENGNESAYDATGTEIATGTSIRTSVMEDYADLEILTGNMYSKRGAHTTIENTRRWASNEDYNDTTTLSMNVNEGGYQPSMSMKAISGGASAEVNVTASGRVGEVQIQADEISLMGVGCYITHGYVSDATTPANSYRDFTIVYGHTYSAYPHVIVGMFSNSTSPTMGSIQVAVASVGYDSATVRVFNNTSSQRSPRFYWLAIG